MGKGKTTSTSNELINIPDTFRKYNAYYKKGNKEYYCQDFAYSIIYGNLNIENKDKIMELLDLETFPTLMFLIRIDDFNDIYDNFPKYQKYPCKAKVLTRLEKILKEKGISNVSAAYLGRDTIASFLCLEGEDVKNKEERDKISQLVRDIIDEVKERENENISIGISQYCKTIEDFQEAYIQCKSAFKNNFRRGRRSFSFYDEKEFTIKNFNKEDIDSFTMKIIYELDNLNQEGYTLAVNDLIEFFNLYKLSSIDIKMYSLRIIDYISNYYIKEGLSQENIDSLGLTTMKNMLNSDFLSTVQEVLKYFCNSIYHELIPIRRDLKDNMKSFIENCIQNNYSDSSFNLNTLSQLCNYNPYYFGRLFKNIFKDSFNQYLTKYRIEKSKDYILHSQLTIEEIAFRVGFSSVSYFCTNFKRLNNATPSDYKKGF